MGKAGGRRSPQEWGLVSEVVLTLSLLHFLWYKLHCSPSIQIFSLILSLCRSPLEYSFSLSKAEKYRSTNTLLLPTFKHKYLYFLPLHFQNKTVTLGLMSFVYLAVLRTLYQPKCQCLTFWE